MSNVTDVAGAPDQTAALIMGTVQAAFFLWLGPIVLIYGPSIFRVATFLRCLFASNYLYYIGTVNAVDQMSAIEVFTEKLTVLVVGTLSLTIAALRSRKIRSYTAGAVLGLMISGPLCDLLRQNLYYGPAVGCTDVGEKTPLFPNGEPLGCDKMSRNFQLTFQLTKTLAVLIVTGFAFAGKKLMDFSIAMMGATMVIKGLLDFLQPVLIIVEPDDAVEIYTLAANLELPCIYGLAGLGWAAQKGVLKYVLKPENDGIGENDEIRDLKTKLRDAQRKKAKEDGKVLEKEEKTAVLKSKEQMKCCSCMVTGPVAKYVSLVHLIDDMMGKHMEGTPGKKKAKVSPVLMGKKILRMATTKKKSADDVAAAVTV